MSTRKQYQDSLRFKAAMRETGGQLIERLKKLGYKVEKETDFRYVVDGVIEMYPTNRRFWNKVTGVRGDYSNPLLLLRTQIGEKSWFAKLLNTFR